jgi:hypothetical protein
MKVEKLVKGRNSVQCVVRTARGLSTVRHETLQRALCGMRTVVFLRISIFYLRAGVAICGPEWAEVTGQ